MFGVYFNKKNDNLFYNVEYFTSINIGYGIKLFKSFLNKRNSNYKKYHKLLLTPSKKIISISRKYVKGKKYNKDMHTKMG